MIIHIGLGGFMDVYAGTKLGADYLHFGVGVISLIIGDKRDTTIDMVKPQNEYTVQDLFDLLDKLESLRWTRLGTTGRLLEGAISGVDFRTRNLIGGIS